MIQVKKTRYYLWMVLFFTPFIYGQNVTNDQLVNKWISSVKIFDGKDTIASSNEILHLKPDGSMLLLNAGRGMASGVDSIAGSWIFDKTTHQLQMSIALGERTETIALTVDAVSDQNLSLTQKRGERSKTVIYIPKKGEPIKKAQLMHKWVSSIKIINQKQTLKKTNETLQFKPEGVVVIVEGDKTHEGSWKFDDVFNMLYININYGDRMSMKAYKVDLVTDQKLSLTDTKSRDEETIVYIKKP